MNILHLRSSDLYGSPERLIIGQCRHLPQFQFVCASYARDNARPKFLDECEKAGFQTAMLHESFPGDLRVISQLRQVIIGKRIDLIVSHDYKSTFYSYWAVNGLKTGRIAYYHGLTSEDWKVKIYNAIDTFMLKRTPKIIAVSQQTKQLLQHRGINAHRIVVVPNAIDTSALSDKTPVRSEDGPIKLIAAGRFSYEKGFDILLEATACLLPSTTDFVLYLYGRGPEEERLRQLAAKLKLGSHVQFMGFVDDIRPVFRTMDALVLPSRSEGMPLIILEAWSERLGVLATTVGGIPEMISQEKTGLLIPPYDISALSEALKRIISDRTLAWRYGEEGHQLLFDRYSLTKQAEQLAVAYTSSAPK